MNRFIAMIGAVLVVGLFAADAAAHDVPARRSVVVQVDKAGVAVLITWTSARGPQGAQMLARAAWGRSDRALAALRSIAGGEALRGLEITVDGKPVKPTVQVKVRVDKRQPARVVAIVLLTVPRASGVIRVATRAGPATQITWRDKTRGRVRSAHKPGTWLSGRRTLRLLVRDPTRPAN